MVEIGPGLGALTLPLLEHLEQLEVIELDRDIIPRLQAAASSQQQAGQLHINEADVLKVDFKQFLENRPDSRGIRMVGNLPYDI